MPKRYPKAQRDRAVHIVLDRLDEHPTLYAACEAIGAKAWDRFGVAARVGVAGSD